MTEWRLRNNSTIRFVGEAEEYKSIHTTGGQMDKIDVEDGARRAVDIANAFGGIDGEHHKAWVIDQMVRALLGCTPGKKVSEDYARWVREHCEGEDGPDTYEWPVGIPP